MKERLPHLAPNQVGPLGLANIALALALVLSGTGGLSYLVLKATVGQPLPASLAPYYMHSSLLMLAVPASVIFWLLRAFRINEGLRMNLSSHLLLSAGNTVLAIPVLTRSLTEAAPALLVTTHIRLSHYLGLAAWPAMAALVLTLSAVVFRATRTTEGAGSGLAPARRLMLAGLLAIGAGYAWFTVWAAAAQGRDLVDLAFEVNPWFVKSALAGLALTMSTFALVSDSRSARAWISLVAFSAAIHFAHTWKVPSLLTAMTAAWALLSLRFEQFGDPRRHA